MIGPNAWERFYHTKGKEFCYIFDYCGMVYEYTFVDAWEMFSTKGELYKWCQDDAMYNNGGYADRMYKDEDDDAVCEPDCVGCQGVDSQ